MNTLRIADKAFHIRTLGPGNRFCLWLQGCMKHCPGCTSPTFKPMDGGTEFSVGTLAIIASNCGDDGITISGGEPFLQPEGLSKFLAEVRRLRPEMTVIIYTGYVMEDLRAKKNVYIDEILDKYCDLLIDGEYVRELDDGGSLRGSSNQRVIPLSERLKDSVNLYGTGERIMQTFEINSEITKSAGIPNHMLPPEKSNK